MNISKNLNKKTIILLILDILIINMAYFIALFFRFDGSIINIPEQYLNAYKNYAIINTILTIAVYSIFRLYKMILEYASYKELVQISRAVIISFLLHIIGISILFQRMPISYFVFGFLIQYVLTFLLGLQRRCLLKEATAMFLESLILKDQSL